MPMTAFVGPSARILSSPSYKWWAYGAIAVGMFVTVMDQSGVNIALPRIADRFSADIPTVQWITLGYVLSTAALLMPMGRLSDMLGRKTVYLAGFVVFMAAAALGGGANTLALIIIAKIVQGVGAAAIQANGLAMVAQVFPESERGKGMGMYMAVIGTGSISGPVIGAAGERAGLAVGVLCEYPPGPACSSCQRWPCCAGETAPPPAERRPAGSTGLGPACRRPSLVSYLLAMTNGHRLGWDSPAVVGALVLATLLLGLFLWWETRAEAPDARSPVL